MLNWRFKIMDENINKVYGDIKVIKFLDNKNNSKIYLIGYVMN